MPEVLALLREAPEVAAMTAPLQNTCGTQQNDAAASEKGFRVFSLGNTGLGHIGDFQIICAQYVRLAW